MRAEVRRQDVESITNCYRAVDSADILPLYTKAALIKNA
jgi:hypothetical protein